MSELTLLILRIGFLILLWFFIFAIVYALRSDLFGAPVRKIKSEAGMVPAASGGAASASAGSAQPLAAAAPVPAPARRGQGSTQPQPYLPAEAPLITPSGGALPAAAGSGIAQQLVITSGVASGTAILLDDDYLTIGRSSESTLVIVDEFTSTYHARLARSGDQWILTDLDSTNGTRMGGTRITKPVTVPVFTPVTIGTTTFELRP